jgi:N6-L-threonylcarbamoyladenine synthase
VASDDVAASFQEAVVDVLVAKTMRAAASCGARAVVLGGGVSANSRLREVITDAGAAAGLRVGLASRAMCTDNAAMIAAAGWHLLRAEGPSPLDVGASPNLALREVP